MRNATGSSKVLASVAVVGAAVAVAGLGTFGAFTDSTTPIDTQVATGTVDIELGLAGAFVPLPTTGYAPGDTVARAVQLRNDGSADLSSVRLDVAAPTGSVLTSDPTHGLQLTIESCSQAWTQGGAPLAPAYTCGGSATLLADGPIVGTHDLAGVNSLAAGGTDNLLVTVTLPETADNSFQAATSGLQLVFTAVQRDGADR